MCCETLRAAVGVARPTARETQSATTRAPLKLLTGESPEQADDGKQIHNRPHCHYDDHCEDDQRDFHATTSDRPVCKLASMYASYH